ncbi:MAG: hypothetical protein Q9166_004594 [cf. Caloplaca sp. 2 TL-2023]
MERAPLLGPGLSEDARQSLREIRRDDNDTEIIQHRVRRDVDAVVNPARYGDDPTEQMTTEELQAMITTALARDRQHLQDDQQWLRHWQDWARQTSAAEQQALLDPDRTPRATPANLVQQPAQAPLGLSQFTASNQPGLPPIHHLLLPLLIPQIAHPVPSHLIWDGGSAAGHTQQHQVRSISFSPSHRPAQQRQPSGFPSGGPPQNHGGSSTYGNADRGQVRHIHHPHHRTRFHQRQPFGGTRGGPQQHHGGGSSSFGSARRGQAQQGEVRCHCHPQAHYPSHHRQPSQPGPHAQQHGGFSGHQTRSRGGHQRPPPPTGPRQQPPGNRGNFHQG